MISKYEQNFISMLFSVRQHGKTYISKADGEKGMCEFHVTFGVDCDELLPIPLLKSMQCKAITTNMATFMDVINGIEHSIEIGSMDNFGAYLDGERFDVSFQELNGSLHALITVTERPVNMLTLPNIIYSTWYIIKQYSESHEGIEPGIISMVLNRVVLKNSDENKVRNLIGNYLTLVAAGKYLGEMKDKEVSNDLFIKWIDDQVDLLESKSEYKNGKKVVDSEYITFKQVQDRIQALRSKYVGLNFLKIYKSDPVFKIDNFESELTDYDALPNDLE